MIRVNHVNGANGLSAVVVPLKTIRAKCESCDLEIQASTVRELRIEAFAQGGGVLLDNDGRVLCCPFCRGPLDGALYRTKV
jgi:hypothetical protein